MSGSSSRVFREVERLTVGEVGRIVQVDRLCRFALVDPGGAEVTAVADYLLQLTAGDYSPNTLRTYANGLLRFFRFLWAVDVTWERATEVEVRDYVLWARQAKKFSGNKRAEKPRGRVNTVTGKRNPSAGYSPGTINNTLSATAAFYDFQIRLGSGPLVNPVPGAGQRRHAGHNPDGDFRHARRAPLRQREPKRVPRAIPDAHFDSMFRKLRWNRDRAMVAFFVSTGARAEELLGLTGEMINWGDQLIGVWRKGGNLQWVPAAPDAFIWLRLYFLERGTPGPKEAVWLTLREPSEKLAYGALRAVLSRINVLLETNWSVHDLRHTFAIRALEGGMAAHQLQELLGHASLDTTSIYATPRAEEVIEAHRAALTARRPAGDVGVPDSYDASELATLFESHS